MQPPTFRNLLKLGVLASAALLALQARADDAHSRYGALMRLPTGQYITPTAIRGAVQQLLNPNLPDYPDFIAGEAVRLQLSPDGTTLAILCAGQNSLYKPDGTVDTANSTQYIFLYNVAGVFDVSSSGTWTYAAVASTVLKDTSLALNGVKFAAGPDLKPKHDAAYWTEVTVGFDFSEADPVPVAQFNKVLWAGLMGNKPYPALRGQTK